MFTNSISIPASLSQNPVDSSVWLTVSITACLHLSVELHQSAQIPHPWLKHCCILKPVCRPSLVEAISMHSPSATKVKQDSLILMSKWYTAHSLPSPCWCCPTAAWDQQWRHCGTGGSGLMQPVCCPGLAWPPPETSPPSPAGTPHPPGAVSLTVTVSKKPNLRFVSWEKREHFPMTGTYESVGFSAAVSKE